MSKDSGDKLLSEFITTTSDGITQEVLDTLNDGIERHFHPDLRDTEIVWAVHVKVLYNLCKIVNFPSEKTTPSHDVDDCFYSFSDWVDDHMKMFQDFCDAIRGWEPPDYQTHRPIDE